PHPRHARSIARRMAAASSRLAAASSMLEPQLEPDTGEHHALLRIEPLERGREILVGPALPPDLSHERHETERKARVGEQQSPALAQLQLGLADDGGSQRMAEPDERVAGVAIAADAGSDREWPEAAARREPHAGGGEVH